jgi:hypothetical protein
MFYSLFNTTNTRMLLHKHTWKPTPIFTTHGPLTPLYRETNFICPKKKCALLFCPTNWGRCDGVVIIITVIRQKKLVTTAATTTTVVIIIIIIWQKKLVTMANSQEIWRKTRYKKVIILLRTHFQHTGK